MLRVKTYLDKSLIHGIGVFADENIAKGQIVWQFVPLFDRVLDETEWFTIMKNGHPLDKNFLRKYGFWDLQINKIILSGDNDRFTNHSDNPNTKPNEIGDMIAVRDIMKGEEITANYYEIDGYADEKLSMFLFTEI